MTIALPGPVVTTTWLAERLRDPDVVVVDASWYLGSMKRDPRREYLAGHIPGALFFDLDAQSDQATTLPHMLPDPESAGRALGDLGIGSDERVIVYDGSGANLSAPRVWWELRVLGHEQAAVLDGGFQRWAAEKRAIQSGTVTRTPRRFEVRFRPELLRSFDEIRAAVGDERMTLVDARSEGRFEGREPEPRPGLRSGHIPGARNLPYGNLVGADGTLLPPDELIARFQEAGVDLDKPVITSCGSGVSACALALALEVVGHRHYAVYDGSWAEWGAREDAPVATGPA